MPGQRRHGMDHEHYDWSPVSTREPLRWPNGARVALCAIVVLDHLDFLPPDGTVQPPGLYHRPLPEYWAFTHRQYGLRVGVFRVLDVLEKHGIPPTVAMDGLTAENYPYLVRHCLNRGCEIIGHGIAASRMISSRMSETEERTYIRDSVNVLARATGARPAGWLGPEYGESERTPGLLAEAGIRYLCDWANDEQPYPMKTPAGALIALPFILDLDDQFALRDRRFPVDGYARHLKEAFRRIYRDAEPTGRLMVLMLHPYLIGQPFRIGFLDEALASMVRRQRVWAALGRDIVESYCRATRGDRPGKRPRRR